MSPGLLNTNLEADTEREGEGDHHHGEGDGREEPAAEAGAQVVIVTGEVRLVLEVEMVAGGGLCVKGGRESLLRGDNSPPVG